VHLSSSTRPIPISGRAGIVAFARDYPRVIPWFFRRNYANDYCRASRYDPDDSINDVPNDNDSPYGSRRNSQRSLLFCLDARWMPRLIAPLEAHEAVNADSALEGIPLPVWRGRGKVGETSRKKSDPSCASPIHPSRHARAILLYPPAARFLLADCLPLRFHALASDVMFPSKRSFRRTLAGRAGGEQARLFPPSKVQASFHRVTTYLQVHVYVCTRSLSLSKRIAQFVRVLEVPR